MPEPEPMASAIARERIVMPHPSSTLRTVFYAGALSSLAVSSLSAQTHKTPATDQAILARVQHALHEEPAFSGLSITPTVSRGVVTLEGTVDSQAAKKLASNEVGDVSGVKTVLNNLDVAGSRKPVTLSPTPEPKPVLSNQRTQQTSRMVSLPEGTAIPVRIADEITTKTAKPGDAWHGTTSASIASSGYTLIPFGAPVTGRIVDAKQAGHFSGAADLTLEITSVRLLNQGSSTGPEEVSVTTLPWSSKASGRGVNTVEKTGGGAALGAIIGGLAGGGRGVGIGAASGGALGAGTNAITRGGEIDLKPEQLLQFRTAAPTNVTVQVRGGLQIPARAATRTSLETRPADPDQPPQ